MVRGLKKLILIRHGELPPMYQGRYVGSSDVRLSAQGICDCRKLAARFAALNPGKIFVSPMRRARESAAAICPERRDLIYDPRIREVDFGDWENLTFDEIQKTAPPELLDLWFRHPEEMRFPNGASVADHFAAVDEFMAEILALPEPAAAVITHGGVLMRMISQAMKIPPERQFEVLPPRASMTILNFHEGGFAYGE